MDRFQQMQVFAAVVEAGSFVGACEVLDMSKPAVSRHVAELESRLGVRLLHRTTRRLSLTTEGEAFLARCRELLGGVEEAEAEVSSSAGQARGLLKVNAPVSFGLLHLAPLWPVFMARHPEVTMDVTLSDRFVDLVEEGYDLAVRIARLPSSSLVSRRLSSMRMVLCASPAYLRKHGRPKHPSDLAGHATIAYSLLANADTWDFEGPDGHVAARVKPRMRTNSGDTCRAMALLHAGIVLQPSFSVGEDIATGRLVELLPAYSAGEVGIHAVYPTRKHVPSKVRLLVEFLAESFKGRHWLD